ncbi:DUF4145 domain-containing protein [Undibacterium sp. TJN19]|uniref:DUF4145 domain-containing protein n=1 Tax=Undibacterium sp. TJN19 TaxID=3413055 RepID=UPI003BF1CDF2
MNTVPMVIWSHCNECGRETKHDVVHKARRVRTYDYEQHSVDAGSTWTVIQCRGCEEVAMQRIEWCSEYDPQEGSDPATYFPPRISRRKPAWIDRHDVDDEYVELLNEVYVALHANSARLAMMGARALIDAVIRRSVGDQDNFGKGLDALVKKDLMSERDLEIVKAAIDAGHASAHRGHKPSSNDVNVVIDIVERMIHAEILAEQVKDLKKTTPQRMPRAAK